MVKYISKAIRESLVCVFNNTLGTHVVDFLKIDIQALNLMF